MSLIDSNNLVIESESRNPKRAVMELNPGCSAGSRFSIDLLVLGMPLMIEGYNSQEWERY